jgi:hypothetical protein
MKKNYSKQFILFCSLFIFSYVETNAQQQCWTSVGSAGTVDEADLSTVDIISNDTRVNTSTTSATVDIRYNIVATAGLFGGECNVKFLTARYADNGTAAQVLIRLYTFNLTTGVSSMLVELNSNNPIYPQQTVAQAQTVSWDGNFNFSTNIYYIQVQLFKTGTGGNPLIRGLRICAAGVCFTGKDAPPGEEQLNAANGLVEQNTPNPFNKATAIKYSLPSKFGNAQIVITDKYGQTLKQINLSGSGKGTINLDGSTLPAGVYNYSLIVDGRVVSSKQMVLTK